MSGSGFRVQGSGFRVQGSGFRVQGSGFMVQSTGCRDQGDPGDKGDEGGEDVGGWTFDHTPRPEGRCRAWHRIRGLDSRLHFSGGFVIQEPGASGFRIPSSGFRRSGVQVLGCRVFYRAPISRSRPSRRS